MPGIKWGHTVKYTSTTACGCNLFEMYKMLNNHFSNHVEMASGIIIQSVLKTLASICILDHIECDPDTAWDPNSYRKFATQNFPYQTFLSPTTRLCFNR